ncbi:MULTISPECIES: hypothetical protein [unclassified Meiothermus]|uniref:hypothetical protein n=1 Tax=unclassified Meiothermus TaxID=370471 RepID=UPI0010211240|nr:MULTISPECIES: hypothetical protein [unclassified Meiothermus]RYM32702.1 hypothetical protein EWH23_13850 [Meiothermus sp. PNK-Is4]
MRKLKAMVLSGVLLAGGLAWVGGTPSIAYASTPTEQAQAIEPEAWPAVVAVAARAAAWAAEAAVKAVAAYVAVKAAQAVLNGQGPAHVSEALLPEAVLD